jgi:hypothetical protein
MILSSSMSAHQCHLLQTTRACLVLSAFWGLAAVCIHTYLYKHKALVSNAPLGLSCVMTALQTICAVCCIVAYDYFAQLHYRYVSRTLHEPLFETMLTPETTTRTWSLRRLQMPRIPLVGSSPFHAPPSPALRSLFPYSTVENTNVNCESIVPVLSRFRSFCKMFSISTHR